MDQRSFVRYPVLASVVQDLFGRLNDWLRINNLCYEWPPKYGLFFVVSIECNGQDLFCVSLYIYNSSVWNFMCYVTKRYHLSPGYIYVLTWISLITHPLLDRPLLKSKEILFYRIYWYNCTILVIILIR